MAIVSRSEGAVIAVCTGLVLLIATLQMRLVLGLDVTPAMYGLPVAVGVVVGGTLVWMGRMRRHEEMLREKVEQQAGEVLRLNRELQGRVEARTSELQAREAELLQSQKMEAIGRLAGGVAHDFNNLLTAILQGAELIEELAEDPEEVRELAREVRDSADRAGRLTAKLLALGRRRRVNLPPRPVDLADVVRGLQPIVRRLMGERSIVTIELEPATPAVLADRVHLEQVFVNLAVNARDAMPDGGRFSIQVSWLAAGVTDVELAAPTPHGVVWARVQDSGHGIPASIQSQVFEPLFTTKPADMGTGLGLSIVHSILVGAGGAVRLESTEDVGTTFDLFWPAVGEDVSLEPEREPTATTARSLARSDSSRVLLIDDDANVRKMVARVLLSQGHAVTAAADGDEAEAIVRDQGDVFQLVLSDIHMPGRSGVQLVPLWRTLLPSAQVVLMTGITNHVLDEAACAQLGVGEVLRKPFDAQALARRLAHRSTNAHRARD